MTQIDRAEERVADARQNLSNTLSTLQARLDPRTLARSAVDDLADGGEKALHTGVETARNHPRKVAGAAALIALLLGRKRIAALIGRVRRGGTAGEKPTTPRRVRSMRPRPAPARRDTK